MGLGSANTVAKTTNLYAFLFWRRVQLAVVKGEGKECFHERDVGFVGVNTKFKEDVVTI